MFSAWIVFLSVDTFLNSPIAVWWSLTQVLHGPGACVVEGTVPWALQELDRHALDLHASSIFLPSGDSRNTS